MPGFMDAMRQRFRDPRAGLTPPPSVDPVMSGSASPMMQPPPQLGGVPQIPGMNMGSQFQMPSSNSGFVKPGLGIDSIMQSPDDQAVGGNAAPLNPMQSPDQRAIPRKMGGRNRMASMKLGRGGEPVF